MQTVTFTAKDIHADFYGAEERLFVEAVGLTKRSVDKSLVNRYSKIGFGNVKAVNDAKQLESKKALSENLIAAIEYFRVYYPNYKFITEAEVKKLCEKYGLLLGDAKGFIGDMPEKNLVDIENFVLRKEDWKEKSSLFENFGMFIPQRSNPIDEYGQFWFGYRRSGRSRLEEEHRRQIQNLTNEYLSSRPILYSTGVDPYDQPSQKKSNVETEQPPFKICAPKEDFNTLGYEIKDGYRLVWDPI